MATHRVRGADREDSQFLSLDNNTAGEFDSGINLKHIESKNAV